MVMQSESLALWNKVQKLHVQQHSNSFKTIPTRLTLTRKLNTLSLLEPM
jgi:hypothetical protein